MNELNGGRNVGRCTSIVAKATLIVSSMSAAVCALSTSGRRAVTARHDADDK